jgi:hypothetical protein
MSMPGYTKLFNSILASTIWRAPNTTRIVWITMLAMADKDGIVEGSVPGLADFARVEVDEARQALAELLAPDPDSRTGDHEGRRIEVVDGTGWRLLNHGKYRAKMSEDERREYNRQKQAEWRNRKNRSNSVNDSQSQSAKSAQAEEHSEAKAPAPKSVRVSKESGGYTADFEAFWKAYPRKEAKADAWKMWKRIVNNPGVPVLCDAIKKQSRGDSWARGFIPHAATWLSGRRWEDEALLSLESSNAPAAPIRATMKL